MISYLIEASVCTAGFYLFYRVFLVNFKLLNLNRGYLMLSVLACVTIPLLNIPLESVFNWPLKGQNATGQGLEMGGVETSAAVNVWQAIYFLGLGASLLMFLVRLLSIRKLIRRGSKVSLNKAKLIEAGQVSISSFFHFVFVPEGFDPQDSDSNLMLQHEQVHTRQYHSVDLILLNALSCLFWFNPFIYGYKKSLKLQHEYIADEIVSRQLGKKAYSRALIQHSLSQAGIALTHSFAEHPVEKRLNMIDKPNSNNMNKLRPLLSLPILGILLLSFACSETAADAEATVPDQISEIEVVEETPIDESRLFEIVGKGGKISYQAVVEGTESAGEDGTVYEIIEEPEIVEVEIEDIKGLIETRKGN